VSVTLLIIIITCGVSYLAGLTPQDRITRNGLFDKLKHYPVAEKGNKEFYRFLSSGFVHGSWTHLIVNMYVLWTFGETIENQFMSTFGSMGRIVYVLFYLSAIVVADIPSFLKHQNNPGFASIGASGAVSAILFVFIMFRPMDGLMFIFFPFFAFPAIVLGIGYLIYSSWANKNSRDNIDHSAHFAGAIYGLVFIIALHPKVINTFVQSIQGSLPF